MLPVSTIPGLNSEARGDSTLALASLIETYTTAFGEIDADSLVTRFCADAASDRFDQTDLRSLLDLVSARFSPSASATVWDALSRRGGMSMFPIFTIGGHAVDNSTTALAMAFVSAIHACTNALGELDVEGLAVRFAADVAGNRMNQTDLHPLLAVVSERFSPSASAAVRDAIVRQGTSDPTHHFAAPPAHWASRLPHPQPVAPPIGRRSPWSNLPLPKRVPVRTEHGKQNPSNEKRPHSLSRDDESPITKPSLPSVTPEAPHSRDGRLTGEIESFLLRNPGATRSQIQAPQTVSADGSRVAELLRRMVSSGKLLAYINLRAGTKQHYLRSQKNLMPIAVGVPLRRRQLNALEKSVLDQIKNGANTTKDISPGLSRYHKENTLNSLVSDGYIDRQQATRVVPAVYYISSAYMQLESGVESDLSEDIKQIPRDFTIQSRNAVSDHANLSQQSLQAAVTAGAALRGVNSWDFGGATDAPVPGLTLPTPARTDGARPDQRATHAYDSEVRSIAELRAQTVERLRQVGIEILRNSGRGMNCMIYAVLQQITGLPCEQLDDEVANIRSQFDRRHPELQHRMLYADDVAARDLIHQINERFGTDINIHTVQPSATGPAILPGAQHSGTEDVYLLTSGTHYEPLTLARAR